MPPNRTAAFLLAMALVCATGPWLLELAGFTFASVADGGAGGQFAACRRGDTLLRLDVIMLVQALLVLGLILGFHDLHRQRLTLMLGLTLAGAAALGSVQVVHLPAGDAGPAIAAAAVRAEVAAGTLLLIGALLIRLRHRLAAPVWLGAGLGATCLLFVASHQQAAGGFLARPEELLLRAELVMVYVVVALLLLPELRRSGTFAFGLAAVAGLLPQSVAQIYLLVQGAAATDGSSQVANVMHWYAYLLPIFGLSIDLARRAAAQSAASEQAFLREILDSLPDAVFARDLQGRFVLANAQAGGFFGRAAEELPGLHVRDVYPDAATAERWLADDQGVAAQGDAIHPDVEYRDAAGELRWLHIKKRPLATMPGQPSLVLAVGTDVTERKRAELAVQERLAFQDVIARTLSLIVGCGRESFAAGMKEALGNVAVFCRAQTAVIYRFDWPQQRIVEVHFWRDVPAVRPTVFPLSLISPALPALTAGEAYGYSDPRTLPVHAAPMRDKLLSLGIEGGLFVPVVRDGILWGALGLYRRQAGLTWSTNDEAVLRTLADILIGAHARHEAEEQVVAAMQAAQAGNRAKSEFLANMSHEIRTPLNAVIGLADLLQRLDPTPQQQHYLQMVNSAGQTLLSLINDVLDLSRIEVGEVVLESLPVNLVETAGEVVNVLALQAERKGLELVLRVAPDVPDALLGDPLRLQQILMNLVGNAVKFTEHGLVELAISRQSDGIRLRVQDSGIGIPAPKLREIFESFTQADASHTRRYGGSGLGLAICRQLVTLMGGVIQVESESGQGSVFTVDLPLQPAATARPAVCAEPALAGRRVLVALGPAATRAALVEVLQALGVVAETAGCCDDATARLRTSAWDVVVIDSRAGDDDVARCEAAWQAQSSPPRLLVLAGLDEDSRATALVRAGLARPVGRPVNPQRLSRALRDVLASAAATAAEPPAKTPATAIPLTRVLLAEDNPINQKVATSLLRTLGCEVTVVADGQQAVAAAAAGVFDLVLMDCQMPEMDGLEATRRLRALPAPGGTVPVIAITANVLGEHRQACFAAGMDDFVSKPISREALRVVLAKWSVSQTLEVA